MPRSLEAPITDPLVGMHVDPDERGGIPTDFVVDGQDLYAERRRQMREQHDGHADPAPIAVPDAPHRPLGRPPNSVRLNQTSVSQVTPPTPKGPDWTPMSIQAFEAIASHIAVMNPLAERAGQLLQEHECISLALEGKARESMRGSLKTVCRRRGLKVQIKVTKGKVAVRRIGRVEATRS